MRLRFYLVLNIAFAILCAVLRASIVDACPQGISYTRCGAPGGCHASVDSNTSAWIDVPGSVTAGVGVTVTAHVQRNGYRYYGFSVKTDNGTLSGGGVKVL